MRRRPNDVNDGSLELLLDTICNTFGGVLFVALLVVVLVNMTGHALSLTPPTEAAQSGLIALEAELNETDAQLERLRQALAKAQSTAEQFVAPDVQDVAREWRQEKTQLAQHRAVKNDLLAEMSQAQMEINAVTRKLQANADAIARAREELSSVERLLEAEIAARSQTATLPKVRETVKSEITFFLRHGRLCSYARPGGNGDYEPNLVEIVETVVDGQTCVEPKPNAGTVVPLEGDPDAVEARFREFNPDRHYIAIFVWPDSFPHFSVVKDVLVAMQYEYRLVPITEEGKVYIGPARGPRKVQ